MKKKAKPLALHRETVAALEDRRLRDAAGQSAANGICSRPCPISLSCPGKIC
jgi:hypothetical protein